MRFRIQQNTDNVDIDSQCLGLSSWVPGDSLNLLNSNRGLHIQIRHNGCKDTFEATCKLSKLIGSAPEMLEAMENVVDDLERFVSKQGAGPDKRLELFKAIIAKANGQLT